MADVAERLAALLSMPGAEAPTIRPLALGRAPRAFAAVDGSSVVLAESGSHLVGAHRAALVTGARARPGPTRVCLLSGQERGLLDELRGAGERALALDAIAMLDAGDLLLLDGALNAADDVLRAARDRGVDVVGVCKSTSLTVGGAPALAACQLAARSTGLATWWAELPAPMSTRGRVAVARLSRAEERPFRFDIASRDEPDVVLARVAALAGHPAYPGYPSPLAMAHQAAVIADDERRRLAADVMDQVAEHGVKGEAWRAAFVDYHEVLELGV